MTPRLQCGSRDGSVCQVVGPPICSRQLKLFNRLPWNSFQTFIVPRRWTGWLGWSLWFFLAPPAGWNFCLLVTCFKSYYMDSHEVWHRNVLFTKDERFLSPQLFMQYHQQVKVSLILWKIWTSTRWVATKLGTFMISRGWFLPPQSWYFWLWVKCLSCCFFVDSHQTL